MSVRVLLVLSVVIAVALGETVEYHGAKNISLGEPFKGHFGPWNLRSMAKFSVTHTDPIVLCIVPTAFELPSETQYGEDVCTFFRSFPAEGEQSVDLGFLHANYTFGVYFASKDVKKTDNSTVTVHILGEICGAGEYFDSQNCIPASVLHNWNDTVEKQYEKGETAFFTFDAPARVSSFTAKLVTKSLDAAPEDFVIYARFNGGPSKDDHDFVDHNGTIAPTLPRPGTWVFSVHASAGGEATFGLSDVKQCGVGQGGENCETIPTATDELHKEITATGVNSTFYYYFQATQKQGLQVSITTENGTLTPLLFASRNQLPDVHGKNADIKNCNGGYCNIVRSIAHNVTEPEDWFIAVVSNLTSGKTTFGIWFNTTCVAGCETENRGLCNPDGTCDCQIDYEGIDCSISKGLGPHYIVLIIIASLVVASAVIGFVAWAYMRRKRQNYEILS